MALFRRESILHIWKTCRILPALTEKKFTLLKNLLKHRHMELIEGVLNNVPTQY